MGSPSRDEEFKDEIGKMIGTINALERFQRRTKSCKSTGKLSFHDQRLTSLNTKGDLSPQGQEHYSARE